LNKQVLNKIKELKMKNFLLEYEAAVVAGHKDDANAARNDLRLLMAHEYVREMANGDMTNHSVVQRATELSDMLLNKMGIIEYKMSPEELEVSKKRLAEMYAKQQQKSKTEMN
jgi:hypothetical protein